MTQSFYVAVVLWVSIDVPGGHLCWLVCSLLFCIDEKAATSEPPHFLSRDGRVCLKQRNYVNELMNTTRVKELNVTPDSYVPTVPQSHSPTVPQYQVSGT